MVNAEHQDDLFGEPEPVPKSSTAKKSLAANQRAPLADRLRPMEWRQFAVDPKLDRRLLTQLQNGQGQPPSMVLWGPPGTGKTTFARLVGHSFNLPFVSFSAVLGGVKDVREIIDEAKHKKQATILFVDEIHRFNKAQQDAFLPHVENGTIVLIGATTENPSFALTGALMSRVRMLVFSPLAPTALSGILETGLVTLGIQMADDAKKVLIDAVAGDARRLLNLLESMEATGFATAGRLEAGPVADFLRKAAAFAYDRSGDQHYDMISAFIKSLRGSDPNAALFWGFRMLESGEDPRFICRRLMIFASEDIGNADPAALPLAVAAAEAFDRLGVPEGRIPLAQCICYLATAPKSNRSYLAMGQALAAVNQMPQVTVPIHLRNAPTKLLEKLGHGAGYQYPHDNPTGFIPGIRYLPEELETGSFYEPSHHGAEADIANRMKARGQLPE